MEQLVYFTVSAPDPQQQEEDSLNVQARGEEKSNTQQPQNHDAAREKYFEKL